MQTTNFLVPAIQYPISILATSSRDTFFIIAHYLPTLLEDEINKRIISLGSQRRKRQQKDDKTPDDFVQKDSP